MKNAGERIPERELHKIEGGNYIYPMLEFTIFLLKVENAVNKFIESLIPEKK